MLAFIFILLWVVLMAAIILAGNLDLGGSDKKQWHSMGVFDGEHFGEAIVTREVLRNTGPLLFLWKRHVLAAYQQGVAEGISLRTK